MNMTEVNEEEMFFGEVIDFGDLEAYTTGYCDCNCGGHGSGAGA